MTTADARRTRARSEGRGARGGAERTGARVRARHVAHAAALACTATGRTRSARARTVAVFCVISQDLKCTVESSILTAPPCEARRARRAGAMIRHHVCCQSGARCEDESCGMRYSPRTVSAGRKIGVTVAGDKGRCPTDARARRQVRVTHTVKCLGFAEAKSFSTARGRVRVGGGSTYMGCLFNKCVQGQESTLA